MIKLQVWQVFFSILAPVFATLGATYIHKWRRDRRALRVPISEKLLRPAGESLRLKLEKLEEQFTDRLLAAFVCPALLMLVVMACARAGEVTVTRFLTATILGTLLLIVLLHRFFATAEMRRHCNLGFHGERAVAEELNQLLRHGCAVFHDVPMDPYGNIDHVVVAPAGVFAIETKTRTKATPAKGGPDHHAVFDGEAVIFPNARDTAMIAQAKMQAKHLAQWLTKAVAEPVPVRPILTLPGWFVTSKAKPNGIFVLNQRLIGKVALDSREPKLTFQLIQRISHQLEQRCRDVEL